MLCFDDARRTDSQPFAVDVQRRSDVAIVRPHGELDLATAPTVQAALSGLDHALPFVAADDAAA